MDLTGDQLAGDRFSILITVCVSGKKRDQRQLYVDSHDYDNDSDGRKEEVADNAQIRKWNIELQQMSTSREAALVVSKSKIAAARIEVKLEKRACSTPKRKRPATSSTSKVSPPAKKQAPTKKPQATKRTKAAAPIPIVLPKKRRPTISEQIVKKTLDAVLKSTDRSPMCAGYDRQLWVREHYPSAWVLKGNVPMSLSQINRDRKKYKRCEFTTVEEALAHPDVAVMLANDKRRREKKEATEGCRREGERINWPCYNRRSSGRRATSRRTTYRRQHSRRSHSRRTTHQRTTNSRHHPNRRTTSRRNNRRSTSRRRSSSRRRIGTNRHRCDTLNYWARSQSSTEP